MTKRLPPEVKAANKIKFSKIRSEQYTGENNPFFGKYHTEESKRIIRESKLGTVSPRKGAILSEETKNKIRLARVGNFGNKRKVPIQKSNDYKVVSLSNGMVAKVDAEDYEKINRNLWCAAKQRNVWYAHRAIGNKKYERLHHTIFGVPPKGLMIDHINGDGLDNRKYNLRIVTNRENCMNRHHEKTSRYPGVTWAKREQLWIAQAQIDGKHVHIGGYPTEELAYVAYLARVTPIIKSTGRKLLCQTQK